MGGIKFGCQTYTWQMSGEKYAGKLAEIMAVADKAGFSGIELEICMMGRFYKNPQMLADMLSRRRMELVAVVLVCNWRNTKETAEESREAGELIRYLQHFPGAQMVLCQMPGPDRKNLRMRQKNALACINSVADRAAEAGITCSFHPNSPPGSVFRTNEDYEILLNGLCKDLGFAPDAGHIAKGGMDVIKVFKDSRPLIKHVHFKDLDANGEWVEMGKGRIEFPGILKLLKSTNYSGWVVVEDESPAALIDPDAVTLFNGKYIKSNRSV